jgi:hypothetical protein
MVQEADAVRRLGRPLSPHEFKLIFLPWQLRQQYRADPATVLITKELADYFSDLEHNHGIKLDAEQRAWYAVTQKKIGPYSMLKEYPSYPEEAFKVSIEGAYFKPQMTKWTPRPRQQPLATARQRAGSGRGQEPGDQFHRRAAHSQQAGFNRGRPQLSEHGVDRRGTLRTGHQMPGQLQGMGREARHVQITARSQLGLAWKRCSANWSLRLRPRLYPAAQCQVLPPAETAISVGSMMAMRA